MTDLAKPETTLPHANHGQSVDANELISIEREIQKLREGLLRPFAQKFHYPLVAGTASGLPTVLCLGNHSSGKSTFINHLAGMNIQETGVAPTDDGFTLITYGEREMVLDGRATVTDPSLPFGELQQYGNDFLDHLKLKRRPIEALKQVCLIDSPGLIDNPGALNDGSRGYDFNSVVRAFAGSADLIIFFFDPDKPGTTGESLRVFTDSLSDVMYKLLIVFNKVDTFGDVRDFARTYGSLCWNLSRVVRTKDIPHIFCTFVPGLSASTDRMVDLTDFEKSTEELKREIGRVGLRRRTNMVGALLDSARLLRIHATVMRHVGMQLLWMRLAIVTSAIVSLGIGGWLTWYYRDNPVLLTTAAILILLGVGLIAGYGFLLRRRLRSLIDKLDAVFHDIFSKELLEHQNTRFLEGLWGAVKPRTIHVLKTVGPRGVPFSPLWIPKLRKLRRAIESDIPHVLGKVSRES